MTDRPPLHPLSIASLLLGVLAVAFTAVLLSAFWHNPHLYPSDRNNLWVSAWMNRWGWPPLATALIGWIVSAAATQRLTSRKGQATRGLGLARLGLVLSVGSGGLALLGMVVMPAALRPQESALKAQCLANVKEVATALNMYAADWSHFSAADRWTDVAHDYLLRGRGSLTADRSLRCPDAAGDCAYAFNAALDRKPMNAITEADKLVMLFESDRGWNAQGGRELLTDFPRHFGGDHLGFADGHAKWYVRTRPAGMDSRSQARLDTKWPHEYEAEKDGSLRWESGSSPVRKGE